MNNKNPKVDQFLIAAQRWQTEIEYLRTILLDCQLTEELKWGQPCYTFQKKNVALIYGFKAYFGLGFIKGSLMNDVHGILVKQGENSQAVRLIKFTNKQEIEEKEEIIKAYIKQAIEIEKSGLKVDFNEKKALVFPEELQMRLDEDPEFKTAFEALTPGRQRGYNLYFSAPKSSKSRNSRIEKYVERILNGNGIHDCVCGHSKRMPTCDGSHKYI